MQHQKPSKDIKWDAQNFPLVVIAENIHSPANVGQLIRACECFGVKQLYFAGPFSNTDTNKFRSTARAAEKYLDVSTENDSSLLISKLKSEGYKLVAIEITDQSKELSSCKITKGEKLALVMGSERHGVSSETLTCVDDAVHITQFGKTGSLNVSMALGIVLYEITKQLSTS